MLLKKLNDELRERFSVPDDIEGLLVADVQSDSAFDGKLEPPMVILEINGEAVKTPDEVEDNLKDGMNRLYVWAGGQKRFIVLKL